MSRSPDESRLQRILAALTGNPDIYAEIGTPPYTVPTLCSHYLLGEVDRANLRKDLLRLIASGRVVAEPVVTQVWNAIAGRDMPRRSIGYWNAATMFEDWESAEAWRAGGEDRQAVALAAFNQAFR